MFLLLTFPQGRPLKKPKHNTTTSVNKRKGLHWSSKIFSKRRCMNHKMGEQLSTETIHVLIQTHNINIVESDSEEERNLDANIAQQDNSTSPSDDIHSNTSNIQSNSQTHPSSRMPTLDKLNISFLCNPNDEEPVLRQPRVSQLFDKDLNSVRKRSWAKDSTCEQVHLS